MTMTTNKKWNVRLGDITLTISADLLTQLGFSQPYTNDETNTALETGWGNTRPGTALLAESVVAGFDGDQAAIRAISTLTARQAVQSLETARQKVAEINARAAADERIAEGIKLKRLKIERNID